MGSIRRHGSSMVVGVNYHVVSNYGIGKDLGHAMARSSWTWISYYLNDFGQTESGFQGL